MRHLFILWAFFIAAPAYAGHSAPGVVLSIHVQTTGSGLPESEAREVSIPPNGEEVLVRTLPEATQQNLVGVDTVQGGILLTFDYQGRINLSTVTGANQDRILVVLLNGYVIYAPVIDEEIGNGQLLIPRKIDPQIVQMLKKEAAENVKQHAKI